MKDAINHLTMVAADYRRMATPNQSTITEHAARENERLANQFDLAAEALRQMHNRLFEEGVLAGVKSLVDSCNARRQRKASPASAPEGWRLVPVEILDRFPEINPSNYDHDDVCSLNAWGVELVLAAAPTPPISEDKYKIIASLQAKIDELMLEYCQDDMTTEQLAEYARHQRALTMEEQKAIDAAMQEDKKL